jgi:hypothetical protein
MRFETIKTDRISKVTDLKGIVTNLEEFINADLQKHETDSLSELQSMREALFEETET